MKTTRKNIGCYLRICFISFFLFIKTIIAVSQPVAAFTASPTSGCGPLTVQFTDNSTGMPAAWSWDLGNGTISAQQHPTTTYADTGTYTVTLIVKNSNGADTITKTQFVTVYKKPVVSFTVSDSLNCAPFTTHFTDLSTIASGSITNWEWDFDDGSMSTLQNPQHLYVNPGNYTITLKVSNNGGCSNILSKQAYIKILDSISPGFRFIQGVKCKPPETIRFINNSVAPGTISYWWNFGDGITSTASNPSHTYLTSGLYSISLVVKNNMGCADTLLLKDTLFIKNVNAAIAVNDTVCNNIPVTISNATNPVPLTSAWNFGDGSSTFGNNTIKRWTTPGNYLIQLINNFSTCSDTISKQVVVRGNPIVNFITDFSASCKAPFTVHFSDLSADAVSWNWNFGDNSTSTQQHPVHTYTSEGEYDVQLSITDRFGCQGTITRKKQITIQKPVTDINLAEGGGCIPYLFHPYPAILSPDSVISYYWDFGNGNTSTLSNPATTYTNAGDYTIKLIITTAGGCIDSSVKINGIKTGTPPVVNFGASTFQACPGVNIQFSDSSNPADSWLWIFGDGNNTDVKDPMHNFADSGLYTIRLIATNHGCSDTLTKPKYIYILPGLARFRPIYNCTNKNEIFFKDSSTLPQTWAWDFGDGNSSNLSNPVHTFAGYHPYTVSLITSNAFCTDRRVITVNPIKEVPDFTVSKSAICKTDSVAFYLTGFNKSNITHYTWNYGDGTTDSTSTDSLFHQYKLAGDYQVTLTATDVYGCDETVVKSNFIHVYGPVAGFTINAPGGCANKLIFFTDTSNTGGKNNIAHWQWNFGDGQSQLFTAPLPVPVSHSYINPGNYFPSLNITDSVGCTDSIQYSQPVKISQPIASFFAANPVSCSNDSIIFRNPSTGSPLNFLWSFGDGSFSTDSIPLKKYAVNGDYSVQLTITDVNGCKDSLTKTTYIKLRDAVASFTISDSIGTCLPLQVVFRNTSANAVFQQWDFGDGTYSSSGNTAHYYTDTGTYIVKLTVRRSANYNCASIATKTIRITAPKATISYSPTDGCAPLSVNFFVSTLDKVYYTWDFNDGTSFISTNAHQTHNYVLPGKFVPKVFLRDSGGCIITVTGIDTVKLYSSKVNFGASDTLFCNGGTAMFFDSTISGSAVTSYKWNFGDGNTSSVQNPTHNFSNIGFYNISLAISTIYGCKDSLVKNNFIKVAPTPSISIAGDTTFCGASAVSLTAVLISTDTSTITWKWNWGNGNTNQLQNPPPQIFSYPGVYPVLLMAFNSDGCTDSAQTNIVIFPAANTFAGNDTSVCLGDNIPLLATGADNYTWYPAAMLSCTNCSNPVSTTINSTSYFVKGTNSYGCEKTDTVNIEVKKPFHLTGLKTFDSVCAGNSINLFVSGAEKYIWTPAIGLSNSTIPNPVATPAATAIYMVTGADSINCYKDSAAILIKVNPNPSVNAGPDQSLSAGGSITLSPAYSSDIINWDWQPGTGLNCSSCPDPVATPLHNSTYKIKVANSNGCTKTDEISIWVKCDKSNLFIPTAFTPNNDQLNRVFYPRGTGILKIVSLKIYNRPGQLVFQNANFYANDRNAGWDGLYKGRPAPVGNYIYTIEFICHNNEIVNSQGNILLLR